MGTLFHSVRLTPDRCKGCVNCIKRCPTEAIRIRSGKAIITEERCIDCGECIRRCPNHAKAAVTDCLEDLASYRYNIALPAPSLYGQFPVETPVDAILGGLRSLGFDEVYEVASGAEIVTLLIRQYLDRGDIKRPAISSACPAVVRLVQVRFPELIDHLIPVEAPVEVAARLIRAERARGLGLDPGEIGAWFITPCPAKMTAVRQPLGAEKSSISGAIAISKIYPDLLRACGAASVGNNGRRASWIGVGWAVAGGDAGATEATNSLVVHDIQNVSELLEQVAMGKLNHIDYVEALACAGGCIGGPLTVENRFVAEQRLRQRVARMKAETGGNLETLRRQYDQADIGGAGWRAIEPRPIMRLDEDIFKAMVKVEQMEKTLDRLPGLDCGSCGSPNCKALAEDIVQGLATETDCLFKLRERVHDLAQEMVDLAEKLPPALGARTRDTGPQAEAGPGAADRRDVDDSQ